MLVLALLSTLASANLQSELDKAFQDVTRFDKKFKMRMHRFLAMHGLEDPGIVTPRGDENLRMFSGIGFDFDEDFGKRIFLAWKEGGRIRACPLFGDSKASSDNAIDGPAIVKGNRLVVCGQLQEVGNAPSPAVRLYRRIDRLWKPVSNRVEMEEIAFAPRFINRDGSLVRLTTRPYPDHLGVAHAGPHLLYDTVYRVEGDNLKKISHVRRDTAFASLEDIAAAIADKNESKFNRLVDQRYRASLWPTKHERGEVFGASNTTNRGDDLGTSFDIRGNVDYRIEFGKQRGTWRVIGLKERH